MIYKLDATILSFISTIRSWPSLPLLSIHGRWRHVKLRWVEILLSELVEAEAQGALVALSTAPLISYLCKKLNFPSSEAAATVFVTI